MDPSEFQLHVDQNLHRIRWWCDENNVHDIAQIPWGKLWEDVKAGLNWDTMNPTVSTAIDQAMGPARQKLEEEGVLFPEGWKRNPAHL